MMMRVTHRGGAGMATRMPSASTKKRRLKMVERSGYIVATENFAADQQTDGEVMGLGFMPCEPSGEPWSPKQEAKSEKLGFKKVLAVVSNVTRSEEHTSELQSPM